MEKNCSSCLHARTFGNSETVKVCLNAGTFVNHTDSVCDCPGHLQIPSLRELYDQDSLRMAI
jgi:hypothetical protein